MNEGNIWRLMELNSDQARLLTGENHTLGLLNPDNIKEVLWVLQWFHYKHKQMVSLMEVSKHLEEWVVLFPDILGQSILDNN